VIKRPFLQILGRKYYVYALDGSPVCFLKHPLLKLRGEFTIYADEDRDHAPAVRQTTRGHRAQHCARCL
jgi:hypothetical protein